MQDAYLITGASRGLGLALAEQLAARGDSLFLVARGQIGLDGERVISRSVDLADTNAIESLVDEFIEFAASQSCERITLVNNAGMIEPIKPASRCSAEETLASIQVNLVAPMQLTNLFLGKSEQGGLGRRVFNISSGAANTAYSGWSHYCAGKAGLDHFGRCVGVEQAASENPALVVSIAPGVIDTRMQTVIRATSEADFPALDKFVKLKESGQLFTPEQAAEKLIRFMASSELETGGNYDIRDFSG